MTASRASHARLCMLWIASFSLPALAQLVLSTTWGDLGIRTSPSLLFAVVLVAASLCALASGMVITRAKRTNEMELAYLGLFFLAVSVLALVHGLMIPGVIFGANTSTTASAFWSVPMGLLVGLPLFGSRRSFADAFDGTWQRWVLSSEILIVGTSVLLVVFPNLLPEPTPGSATATAVAVVSLIGCVTLSKRHYDLARIARTPGPLALSLGYGLVGSSMLMWVGAAPYSTGFWVARLLDIFGVFLGTVGALVMYRHTDRIRTLLEPVLVVDPLSALEIGLEPSVHRFVAELEKKDPITRDHVLRTTELAMVVGQKMDLNAEQLRELGLTAMLHDIGKLLIPDAILNKPGSFTDEEYKIMKRHAAYGADLAEASGPLASIAPAIGAHHERIDGSGYPLGLIGNQIPLIARIVSVCDAYDAMSNTRQYRRGWSTEASIEILERHAGSQWDRRVVEIVARTVRTNPPRAVPEQLDMVGRIGCDCIPQFEAA